MRLQMKELMIKILTKIIETTDFTFYKDYSVDKNRYFLFENKKREEFLLVTECNDLSEYSDDYSELIIKLKNDLDERKLIDKNISLLIFTKIKGKKDYDKIEDKLFQIEENPYNFKKYVLTYEEAEINDFNNKIKNGKISYETLNNNLNDVESFENYKTNIYIPTFYSLLIKIFIKIPILKLNILPKNTTDLQEKINTELDKKDLTTFNEDIFKIEREDSADNIISKLKIYIIDEKS